MGQHSSAPAEAADLLLETLRPHGDVDIAALRERWAAVIPAGLGALAEYEGCVLWLHRRFRELCLLDAAPAAFSQWLSTRAHQLAARNLLVDAQRDALVRILNELGVPHMLLKGAARRLLADIYPYADARSTTDVDVLVPAELARSTWLRLQGAGFAAAPDTGGVYRSHFHLPPLRNGHSVTVELHMSTSNFVPAALAWRRLASTGRVAMCTGEPTRVPGATELLWHAITHAPLPHPHAFRLRYFQDALVVWAAAEEVDWGEIAFRLCTNELPHRALARRWLGAAARLAQLPDAARLLRPLPAPDLSKVLRWRLSVWRLLGDRGRRLPRPVWGSHPVSRGRRLLIDAGTRAELRLPSPPLRDATSLGRLGRWVAAGAAGTCYRAWCGFTAA